MTKTIPIEIKITNAVSCYVRGEWEARAETPAELAARFVKMIDALARIDPVLSLWKCGKKRTTNFELARNSYAEEIAQGVARNDWGKPIAIDGYLFGALTRDTPRTRSFALSCRGGSIVDRPFTNHVMFETSLTSDADPDVMTYRIFRPALTAIVDAWEPMTAAAYTQRLRELPESEGWFPPPWIQYLSPWLAEKITPPATSLVEPMRNGGLVMSATTDSFDVKNPQHMAVAKDIAAAMAPLNELPWPSQPSSL